MHKELEGNGLLGFITPEEGHIILTGKSLFSIHVLDLEQKQWHQFSAEGYAPTTRIRTNLTLLNINQAIFFGGVENNEVKDDAYLLDITDFQFEWSMYYTRGTRPAVRKYNLQKK
jgi:hypothetical protein